MTFAGLCFLAASAVTVVFVGLACLGSFRLIRESIQSESDCGCMAFASSPARACVAPTPRDGRGISTASAPSAQSSVKPQLEVRLIEERILHTRRAAGVL
jgi:hypothetical protein